MAKILVVDDDARLVRLLTDYLHQEGHEVFSASDGEQGLAVFGSTPGIDLVVLDVMMPRLDGWVVLRDLRSRSTVRVMLLTSRKDERDELLGFELGVDEYVHKPFSPRLLMARISALLRRPEAEMASASALDLAALNLKIDLARHRVHLQDQELDLAPRLFGLLVHLARNPGLVFSRERLVTAVWGDDFNGDLRTVDTHVKKLREKLGPVGPCLQTVRGFGYRLEVPTAPRTPR